MAEARSIATPMVSGPLLSARQGEHFSDVHLYRSIVGALQYATLTRPEISFSVNKACQFMHSPTLIHWQLVKRILRYLKGTIDHGLFLAKPITFSLHGYADEDWASDPDDRKSTSGFCVFFGGNLVTWGSKKQSIISRSSTEAEYRCLATTVTELCESGSALQDQHVELDIYFVCDLVLKKKLLVYHLLASNQIADVLTKPLFAVNFNRLKFKLNVRDPSSIGLRGVLRQLTDIL
ncbi:uncharacterized protein LOC111024485 [Momordica charantia]|uniref:Uncharacterized protein LOC111024485 n=1 Tax=Momordica charantia TaxID=3673 RepID=A0A6J1DUJ4_MOMCH|nr:uncharacterized protein LOC111024485 [Momordica charantia]